MVAVGFSLFTLAAQLVTVVGVLLSTMLSIRFGKKAVALVGFVFTTIFVAARLSCYRPTRLARRICWNWREPLPTAPTIPLLWAMYADVVDYAEWKTGRRTTGVIYATILFGLKAGLALGSAMSLWLLSGYGYVANQTQTENSLLGIRMIVSIYSAIFLCIVVASLVAYKITKRMNLEIQDELAERRKNFQPA